MKKYFLWTILGFILLCQQAFSSPYDLQNEFLGKTHFRGDVVNVVDGDTVDVELDLGFGIKKFTRVRVLKVDTPEKRSSSSAEKIHAKEASDFTTRKVLNKIVLVVGDSNDVYGRLLADVYYVENDKLILLSEQLKLNGLSKKKSYQ
jgi:micrococcal nuclease